VSRNNVALWALAGIGLVALWTAWRDPRARVVVTGWLAASVLAMCPGFWFREHYYIPC
jgi:hypothetical protein